MGAKPSHLDLAFNFANLGDFRAWKSREILTWSFFSPLLCQTTTHLPKKECSKVLGVKPSYFGLLLRFGSFRAKSHEILTRKFFNRIDEKHQHNDWKWCEEGLGAKPSHLGLTSNFDRFLCQKSWNFDQTCLVVQMRKIRNEPKRM